jgi:hypothetical protein
MTVFLAWTSAAVPSGLVGPWEEIRQAAPDLLLVSSTESLSRVYHELKWTLPEEASLLVTALTSRPKLKGVRPGTQTWLRDRLPGASRPETGDASG